jgi:hypothetical protein
MRTAVELPVLFVSTLQFVFRFCNFFAAWEGEYISFAISPYKNIAISLF